MEHSASGDLSMAPKVASPHSFTVQASKEAKDGAVSKTLGSLPTEIRLLIWHFCIPQGRIIRVKAWAYDRPSDTFRFRFEMDEDRSIPMLFNICQETREIARHTFRRGFNNIRDTEKLYWNPESDFFYLTSQTLRTRQPRFHRMVPLQDSFVMVQNIALRVGPGLWYSLTRGICVDWLHGFSNLKYLRLVFESREGCETWDWSTSNYHMIADWVAASAISINDKSTPECIQEAVSLLFMQYRRLRHPEWVPPEVEVYHLLESESSPYY